MTIRTCDGGHTFRAFYITPEATEIFATTEAAQAALDTLNATLGELLGELPGQARYEALCAAHGITPKGRFGYGDRYASISTYETGVAAVGCLIHQRRAFAQERERTSHTHTATLDCIAASNAAVEAQEALDGPEGYGR